MREGDIEAAIQSYVRAGDYKKASAAAGNLPDRPALIGPSLVTPVPPARAAAFAAAAASADLLDDREALAWITDAMAEITPSDGSNPITTGAPAQHAFDVLASMCELMPADQADALLNLLDKIIERPANHYRPTDKATARILLALAYRPAAPPMLARAIIADDVMAGIILARLDVLEAHRYVLAERLTPFATNNREACRAIIRSGADPTVALTLAQTVVEQELAPRTSEPNTYTGYAGAPDAAILASILDQETRNRFAVTMLDRVQDQHQLQYSRWNDLAGLFNIAPYLDQATQEYVLSGVMEVAYGQHIGDLLVSFDFDMRLAYLALRCAARLNPDPVKCQEIEQLGLTLLREAEGSAQWEVLYALAMLPPEGSRLNLEQYAVHPVAAIRALAAIRWAKDPTVLPIHRAEDLARDADYGVRRDLAKALRSSGAPITDEMREIIAILRQDVRRSVRTPALRTAV